MNRSLLFALICPYNRSIICQGNRKTTRQIQDPCYNGNARAPPWLPRNGTKVSGYKSKTRRKLQKYSKKAGAHILGSRSRRAKVADNLLKRDFHADKPFEKLTTDITEFKIGNEKAYLSPVLDKHQHAEYQRLLAEHHITQSMSRKGNCTDNGIMESPRGFIEKLEEYIYYYNNERTSLKLKGMSPVQFRTHSNAI